MMDDVRQSHVQGLPNVDALREAAERQVNEVLQQIHVVADALHLRPLLLGDDPFAAEALEAGEQLQAAVAGLAPANIQQASEHCILQVNATQQHLFQLCSALYNLGNDSNSDAEAPINGNAARNAPRFCHAGVLMAGTSDSSDDGDDAFDGDYMEYGPPMIGGRPITDLVISGEIQQQLGPDGRLRLQSDVHDVAAAQRAWLEECQRKRRSQRALRRAARKRRARRRRRRIWAASLLGGMEKHLLAACRGLARLLGLLGGWQEEGAGLLQGLPDGPLLRVLRGLEPDVRLVCRRFRALYRLPRLRAYGLVGFPTDAPGDNAIVARLTSLSSLPEVTDCDLENVLDHGVAALAVVAAQTTGLQRLCLPGELGGRYSAAVASVQALLAPGIAAGDAKAGELLGELTAAMDEEPVTAGAVTAATVAMQQLMARHHSTLQHLRAPLLATAGLLHLSPSPPALRSLSLNGWGTEAIAAHPVVLACTLQSIACLTLLTRLDMSFGHPGDRYFNPDTPNTSAANVLAAAQQLPRLVDLKLPLWRMAWTVEAAEQLATLNALTALQVAGQAVGECEDRVCASLARLTRVCALSLVNFPLWSGQDPEQYNWEQEMEERLRPVAARLPVRSLEVVVLDHLQVNIAWQWLYDLAYAAAGLGWGGGLTCLKLVTREDAFLTADELVEDEAEVDLLDKGQRFVRKWLDHGLAMGLGAHLRCLELEQVVVPTGFCRRLGMEVPGLQRLVLWKCACAVTKRVQEVLHKRVSVAGLELLQGLTSLTWCHGGHLFERYDNEVEWDVETGLGLGCLGQLASLRELSTDLGAEFLGALLLLQQLGALTLWEVGVARVSGC